MATRRDPTIRKRIRALDALKDAHQDKKTKADTELKKIRAELRALRKR